MEDTENKIVYAGFWSSFSLVVFDNRKQGWHDKLASTAVIRGNK